MYAPRRPRSSSESQSEQHGRGHRQGNLSLYRMLMTARVSSSHKLSIRKIVRTPLQQRVLSCTAQRENKRRWGKTRPTSPVVVKDANTTEEPRKLHTYRPEWDLYSSAFLGRAAVAMSNGPQSQETQPNSSVIASNTKQSPPFAPVYNHSHFPSPSSTANISSPGSCATRDHTA